MKLNLENTLMFMKTQLVEYHEQKIDNLIADRRWCSFRGYLSHRAIDYLLYLLDELLATLDITFYFCC